MLFVQHANPSPELAPYLYGYVQRISEPYQPEIVEPVVARSGSMLEFQFGDPYDVPLYSLDLPNPSVPITIIGPIPARHVRVIIRGRVEAFTVLFRPLGLYTVSAFHWLALPVREPRVVAFLERRSARSTRNWETSAASQTESRPWRSS